MPSSGTETPADTAGLLAMTVSPPQMGVWPLDPLAAAQALAERVGQGVDEDPVTAHP